MKKATVFKILIILLMALMIWIPNGLADRLYIWTDEKGASHITQHPPTPKGQLKEVLDYTHETIPKQPSPAKQTVNELEASEKELFEDKEARKKRAVEAVEREKKATLLSRPYVCSLQAPDIDVWVSVFNTNSYREKSGQLWSGKIEKYQQQIITPKSEWIIFSYRTEIKGPMKNESARNCSGGGVIKLVR